MSLPTVQAYTFKQFAHEVKVEIYKRIQSDHEGEMTEDDFNDLAGDIIHEELDNNIDIMYNDEVDRLLCDYGIAKAVNLFHDECGEWANVNEKMLLYAVFKERLHEIVAHDDYKDWCENHCDCE